MKEKIGIALGLIITLIVLTTLSIWWMNQATIDITGLGTFAIIIILVMLASYVLWDRVKNVRKGLPVKDERLIAISYKAGYYGFIAAIWSSVFGPLLIDIIFNYELEGSRVTALVVIVSGFIFMISYLYLSIKGKNTTRE